MAKRIAQNITITIRNWAKYNVRNRDYKAPWWFSLNNRILEDSDIYSLSDAEFRAWTYVLSQASLKKSATITLDVEHAERVCRVNSKAFFSLIDKFVKKSILSESGQDLAGIRPASGTDLGSTIQNNTIQNNTEQNTTIQASPEMSPPNESLFHLAELWNKKAEGLPSVRECAGKRLRAAKSAWDSQPDPEFWIALIDRVKASDFCIGKNDTGWKATFDWFVREGTANKILEGAYDNRKGTARGKAPPAGAYQRTENADDELNQIYKEAGLS